MDLPTRDELLAALKAVEHNYGYLEARLAKLEEKHGALRAAAVAARDECSVAKGISTDRDACDGCRDLLEAIDRIWDGLHAALSDGLKGEAGMTTD